MIQANELRIGNRVLGKEYHETEYREIEVYSIVPNEGGYMLNHSILDGCYDLYIGGPSNVKGIPLTEEWLLKFGFHKKYERCWKKGEWQIDIHKETSVCTFSIDNYWIDEHTIREISFVHELQNLMYFLTSEELPIKPYADEKI